MGQVMRSAASVAIVCAWFGLLLGTAPNAAAAQVTLEGVSINLPAPAGFCELNGSNPSDKHALDAIGELVAKARGNQLLAMSADCQQLADWRAGRRLLGDYGQYQAPRLAAATQDTFRQTCATLRTQGEATFKNMKGDLKATMEESVRRLKVNDQSFAGFLGEDPTACYVALLQKLKAEDGTDITQLTLLAITIVKDRFVFVNRYAPYLDSDTVNATLAKIKQTIAALQAANGG
jgi:hypothetical protein